MIITIQARLDSKRLPRKILADINGKPLFQRLHERLDGLHPIVWCIPDTTDHDDFEVILKSHDYNVFRGSKDNVYQRLIDCADEYKARNIMRVTGDNPLTDRLFATILANAHLLNGNEYTYTKDGPRGTRPEVINIARMKKTCGDIEHLTWDFMTYENKQCVSMGYGESTLRLTIDYPADLERVRKIYKKYGDNPALEDIACQQAPRFLRPL